MSMTEQAPPPTPPKKRRKYARRKKLPAAITKQGPDLAGLTITDCAKVCFEGHGCVITGNFCGHPRKGGLQGRAMTDQAVLERFNRASKMLGKKTMDVRFG